MSGKQISRRNFSIRLFQFLASGGLSHFVLPKPLAAGVFGGGTLPSCRGGGNDMDLCILSINEKGKSSETDYCPGGGASEDVCSPQEGFEDECPGERMPEDECSPSGARKTSGGMEDDRCETGDHSADVCVEGILIGGTSPDQCPAQNASTDVCEPTHTSAFDYCRTGLPEEDECAPDGGNETDECPGGGVLRDTCMPPDELWGKGAGDECSTENHPDAQDSCKTDEDRMMPGAEVADHCGFDLKLGEESSDVCYEGTNDSFIHIGGGDLCIATALPVGDASDECNDGTVEQDFCGMWNREGYKEVDVCIATPVGDSDDLCNPGLWDARCGDIGSDDVCYQGSQSSDECNPDCGDKDECPQGISETDQCVSGMPEDDECPGGASDSDECLMWKTETDECAALGSMSESDTELPECKAEDFVE